jgi:nickel transport protein
MPGRCIFLIVTTALFLSAADKAAAHGMDAQAFIRPGGKIQIESWFSTNQPARGARVQVFGADNKLLEEGKLNADGVFVFSIAQPQALRIVVSAGGGHRKQLTIGAEELSRATQTSSVPISNEKADGTTLPGPVPLATHVSGVAAKDVLIGISFLLAAAAFWLSLRNARKLASLSKREEA